MEELSEIGKESIEYKDIVIVGNGPGGICLSYMLNGNWPYYTGEPHLGDEMLSARLKYVIQEPCESLLQLSRDDLEILSSNIEGRGTYRPLAHLLDQLQHPCVDSGRNLPSLLTWHNSDHRIIDHVVVGKGPPGGAWKFMDPKILTISPSRWMSLPGLDMSNSSSAMRRIAVGNVAAYYEDYVNRQGLAKYFKSGRTVTSVRPEADDDWIVEGYENLSGKKFHYKCKKVVLATGTTNSFNRLGIPREETLTSWVTHDLNDFESRLGFVTRSKPVLVIGAGLSAADAIIAARRRNIPVLHAFREASSSLQSLPLSMYPEYRQIYEMMTDGKQHRYYKILPDHKLIDLGVRSDEESKIKERRVSLQSPKGQIYIFRVSLVAILIGSKPDLSYLGKYARDFGKIQDQAIDGRTNPIEVDDYTYEVGRSPKKGLYAIGPLVGDNFVRFILGGAFGVASHIFNTVYK